MIQFFKIFTFLKNTVYNIQPRQSTGALILGNEKATPSSASFQEVVGTASPVNWVEKKPSDWRNFPVLDQKKSNTCGGNALSKVMGIYIFSRYGTYLQPSRADIYQRRRNKPEAGMYFDDIIKIGSEGVTLEDLIKKDLSVDEDYDTANVFPLAKKLGEALALGKDWIYVPNDIDTIASIIQVTGKALLVLDFFLSGEWSLEYPTVINKMLTMPDPSALHHYYAVTDFGLINGKKYLRIEDSAHFGGKSVRYLNEDWVNRRMYLVKYPIEFKYGEKQGNRPIYDGVTIISAQKCFQYLGHFPLNVAFFEGVGPTTKNALRSFQTAEKLPVTQVFDVATKNRLRQLFP